MRQASLLESLSCHQFLVFLDPPTVIVLGPTAAANAVPTMEAVVGPRVVVASVTVRGPTVAALVGLMMVVCAGTVVVGVPRPHQSLARAHLRAGL
jgi:hypothetical protein